MNKETNNFKLTKRIDDFKKRYHELLNELDNSSFLNVTKFTNSDWIEADHSENVSYLLEENEQVNKNLQIIKNSIKEKLKNLELLSEKSANNRDFDNEVMTTYDDLIEEERNYFHDNKNLSLFRVYDDIERTISKIDRAKEYIEDNVITHIEEIESQKKELEIALNDSNSKIKKLINENNYNKKLISDLEEVNNNLQEETNKAITSWMNLNSQLENLNYLMEQNDEENNLIHSEKDNLIISMEKKINDLLFAQSEVSYFDSIEVESGVPNVVDNLMDTMHKIFFDAQKKIFANENKFNVKTRIIKSNCRKLIEKIDLLKTSNNLINNSILNIEEFNEVNFTFNKEEANLIRSVRDIDQLIKVFKEFLNKKIINLQSKFYEIKNILLEIQFTFKNEFNKGSNKKINWILLQTEEYIEKLNLFNQELINLVAKLENYDYVEISSNLIDYDYWTGFSLFFDKNIELLNNDIKVLLSIKDIYNEYFLSQNKEYKSDVSVCETNKNDDMNFDFETNVIENTISENLDENIIETNDFDNEANTDEINNDINLNLIENTLNNIVSNYSFENTQLNNDELLLNQVVEDKTRPLYEKINNIEIILEKLLKQNETTIDSSETNRFLLEKKYNKNLRLRLMKTKLYQLKLLVESELDNKYLEIIKGLEE